MLALLSQAAVCLHYVPCFMAYEELTDLVSAYPVFGKVPWQNVWIWFVLGGDG